MAAPWRGVFPGTWQASDAAFSTTPPGMLVSEAMLGAAASGAVTGTLTATVPGPSVTSTGSVGFSGTLSLTVLAPTVAITAKVTVTGTGSVTTPPPTVASAGAATVAGSVSIAAPAPVLSGSGAAMVTGTASATVPTPSFTGAGSVGFAGITGTIDTAIPAPSVTASGSVTVQGVASLTMGAPLLSSDGSVGVVGTLVASMGDPTFDALGAVLSLATGTLTSTLGAPVFTAQGSSGVVVAHGYSIQSRKMALEPVTGAMVASIHAPVAEMVGHVHPLQIANPGLILANPVQSEPHTSAPMLANPVHSWANPGLIPANPVQSGILLSVIAPTVAMSGSSAHESTLTVALDAPTFAAFGEIGPVEYDDSEELAIALLLLEAA